MQQERLECKITEQQKIIERLERKVAKLLLKLKERRPINRFVAWLRK